MSVALMPRRLLSALALFAALSLAAAADAQERLVVPERFLVCTTCHGVEFQGNRAVNAPSLQGQSSWYLRRQMEAFQKSWRGTHPEDYTGMEMHPQAQGLSTEQLDELLALLAQIPAEPLRAVNNPLTGDPARGQALYATCAACHGMTGEGNETLAAPALKGQAEWYVARQLAKYRAGQRGYAAGDQHGVTMQAAAQVLASEDDARDVAAYIQTLAPTKPEEAPMKKLAAVPLLLAATAAPLADAEVKRYPLPGSDFPISQAVEVTAGTTLIYHSGMTPRPANPEAERYSPEFWGDTEAQTLSVFGRLEESLKEKGLDFSNVVKMQIYLVGVSKLNGAMDFQGMMKAYRKYFGTEEQPNLPARSAFQVAGLAAPGMLVEIEVVLAR